MYVYIYATPQLSIKLLVYYIKGKKIYMVFEYIPKPFLGGLDPGDNVHGGLLCGARVVDARHIRHLARNENYLIHIMATRKHEIECTSYTFCL